MKSPTHNIKDFLAHADGYVNPRWHFNESRGWLGSGVKDKNGVEIYEGDKVIFGDLEFQGVVVFRNGALGIDFIHFSKQHFTPLVNLIGFTELEIVGHITDTAEENNYVAN